MEKESAKRSRNDKLKKIILKTVVTPGIIGVGILAPNVLGAMKNLGILPKKRQIESIKNSRNRLINKGFLKYYPHGTGHWLGMDVHDSGLYTRNGESRKVEPGMCFTIEPGLYIPENDTSAPAEFRGMGIRIEDDIVVTPQGNDVLTSLAPKEVEEMEALIGKKSLQNE